MGSGTPSSLRHTKGARSGHGALEDGADPRVFFVRLGCHASFISMPCAYSKATGKSGNRVPAGSS